MQRRWLWDAFFKKARRGPIEQPRLFRHIMGLRGNRVAVTQNGCVLDNLTLETLIQRYIS